MNEEIKKAIRKTELGAAVLGAVLSPVPLADELVLFPMYAALAKRIGRAHGLSPSAIPWRPVLVTAASGLAARAALNLAVSFVPGVAAVANAASAVALTEVFGRYADAACASPANAAAWTTRDMMGALRDVLSGAAASPASAT